MVKFVCKWLECIHDDDVAAGPEDSINSNFEKTGVCLFFLFFGVLLTFLTLHFYIFIVPFYIIRLINIIRPYKSLLTTLPEKLLWNDDIHYPNMLISELSDVDSFSASISVDYKYPQQPD